MNMKIYSIIIGYLILFAIGGMCGWILELFFRRIVHKKWINPGFLNGPFIPLYGFGVVILYFISDLSIAWYYKAFLFLVLLRFMSVCFFFFFFCFLFRRIIFELFFGISLNSLGF